MDKGLIARKLDSLARCVARLEQKRPDTADQLANDLDCQDILSINLERAVQLCVDMGAHLLADTATPPPYASVRTPQPRQVRPPQGPLLRNTST